MLDHAFRQRFAGVDRLYGRGTVERLSRAHVAVIGLGGVGSWAAEALARSGIGELTLVDGDDVCTSNSSRQLQALTTTVGQSKVAVMAARLQAINPALAVHAVPDFLTPANLATMVGDGFDLVLDACDAFRVKVELVAHCKRRKLPIVVVGAAGGRADPTQVRVRDLAKTEHDKMLGLVRRKLRDEFGFTRNPKRYFGVPAIYSLEQPRYPLADGSVCRTRPPGTEGDERLDCGQGLGAAMHVTATFGMVAVARVIEKLAQHR
jgi:tRNA A37 threonylcarbamoyladenosine dehydratase